VIQPVQFIAMAQNVGLLEELDLTAIQAAIQALQTLNDAGHGDLFVSINASFQTLSKKTFPEHLHWATDAAGATPDKVIVEVLERDLMTDSEKNMELVQAIEALRKIGFTTQLDDFGTGYSGLAYLAQLPFDGIKIDRSLVRTMLTEPASDAIVRAILNLATELQLTVVAEGVESPEIGERIGRYGCHQIQGFGLARPMPLTDLVDWLDRFDPAQPYAYPQHRIDLSHAIGMK